MIKPHLKQQTIFWRFSINQQPKILEIDQNHGSCLCMMIVYFHEIQYKNCVDGISISLLSQRKYQKEIMTMTNIVP